MTPSCRVCASTSTEVFLSRPAVPVHQNLLMRDEPSARAVGRADLDMAVCGSCGFIFNASFDPAKLSYGSDYENTQAHSGVFAEHISGLARHVVLERSVENSRIVEVGCGKGHFLKALVGLGSGNTGAGFDPSYLGPDEALGGRVRFVRRFYGRDAAYPADVVVCRHVIEHVPEPLALLREVRMALEGSPCARVFFETPCVEWILDQRVIWDFFYEHCSLFSAASLARAFASAGFHVEGTRKVFDGQYLWIEATVASGASGASAGDPAPTVKRAREFAVAESLLVGSLEAQLIRLRKHGKVALWGAGAKGATLANLVDPGRRLLDCLVDINPNKQGRFVPGTGHAILACDALAGREVRSAILMNPNYRSEIQGLLDSLGLDVSLVALDLS